MKKILLAGLAAALLCVSPSVWADDVSNGSWSTTDGSNNAAPPNGWPAGMFPNQVEPSARSNMGGVKRWWERANAALSTTGAAGAYVLTPTNTSYPTAYTQGEIYCAKANFTSVGSDTLNVNGLGAKPLYNNLSRVGAGSIMTGQQICAAYDAALNAGAGGFQVISGISISQTLDTRQVLTASSGTYTTPSGARQLRIRMVGGGGGGGGGYGTSPGANGSTGGTTTFNSIQAVGGAFGSAGGGASQGNGGAGGTAGSGSASWRSGGNGGGGGTQSTANGAPGASGGSSVLGGGGRAGVSSESATGYGGGGGGAQSGPGGFSGGGGGGAEYVEIIINSPSSTYAYAIGAGGAGGSAAGSYDGGAGKQGVIIVDEFY